MKQCLNCLPNRLLWLCVMSNMTIILSTLYTQFRLFEVLMDNFVIKTNLYLTKILRNAFNLRTFHLLSTINVLQSQLHTVWAWSVEHGIQ